MIVCTAIDARYLTGLRALWNSIQRNSPNVEFWVFAHGNDDLHSDILDLGIDNVKLNPSMEGRFPSSSEWPDEIPAMYSRLWMPEIFSWADRSLWLDADTIVLKDLRELDKIGMGDFAVASTISDDPQGNPRLTDTMVTGVMYPGERGTKGLTSGVLLYDHANWREQKLFEKCYRIMNERPNINLKFVVQSVLNLALRGNFLPLHPMWQVQGNRKSMERLLPDARIVHYIGMTPWEKQDVPHQEKNAELWRSYL